MTRSTHSNRYECSDFTSDLDRLFTSILKPVEGWASTSGALALRINVAETETDYEVSADLPGVNPDDVKLELLEGNLSIAGKREVESNKEGTTFHRVERREGEFQRVISLPAAVDADKIEAHFKNGVLFVRLPKTAEQLPKRIHVKPSDN